MPFIHLLMGEAGNIAHMRNSDKHIKNTDRKTWKEDSRKIKE